MVLDVCTELPAPREAVTAAGERTLDWARRARQAHSRPGSCFSAYPRRHRA